MTNTKQKESDLVRAICDYLSLRGYFFWRNNNTPIFDPVGKKFRAMPKYAMRGLPDIIVILNGGVVVFFEVKTSKGIISEHQKAFQDKCKLIGAKYYIIRSIDELQI